jgi:hypothetical protein
MEDYSDLYDVIGEMDAPFGTYLQRNTTMTGGAKISEYTNFVVENVIDGVRDNTLTNDFVNSRFNIDVDNLLKKVSIEK